MVKMQHTPKAGQPSVKAEEHSIEQQKRRASWRHDEDSSEDFELRWRLRSAKKKKSQEALPGFC